MTWSVYVVRCADDSLYCGISTDVERRVAEHNAGTGAKYTKGRGPVVLVANWTATDHSNALIGERWFKKLSKDMKERWIKTLTTSGADRFFWAISPY